MVGIRYERLNRHKSTFSIKLPEARLAMPSIEYLPDGMRLVGKNSSRGLTTESAGNGFSAKLVTLLDTFSPALQLISRAPKLQVVSFTTVHFLCGIG